MNASTVLARAVVAALVRGGVRDVVLCPGSRSAPLAFAAARLADAGVVRLHVRLDERSAGFLALGMAKTSARPVAVVCTSGTAVANLMPAVVEASYAAIPVVVVSADRPVEARGVGAPQTIDQIELFGDTVRCFADLGASTSAVEAADEARMAVRRALEVAAGQRHSSSAFTSSGHSGLGVPTRRGPVHLNVGFRLPLAPDPDVLADPIEPEEVAHWLGPSESDVAGTSLEQPDDEPIHQSPRGVVLAGDLPGTSRDATHQAVLRLARSNGWPILAEPTANLQGLDNVLGHAPLVLGTPWQDQHVPDLVLSMGAFGLSRPTLALLRSAGTHVAIDLPSIGREVCDPVRSAERVLGRVPEPSQHSRPDPAWLASWLAADEIAGSVVGAHLERTRGSRARAQAHGIRPNSALEPGPSPTSPEAHGPGTNLPFPPDVLTGGAVAREVYRTAPADGLLLLAASWPVRHVEALGGRRTGLRVIGNRGANGIDGLVSTAWGAALAHQREGGARALALMGDLAFLHDHNGLLAGVDEERPDLTIVVVDNDGGGIFSQLEQGGPAYASQFDRLFATPQGRDLVEVARAAGVPALRVTTRTALSAALEEASHAVRVIVADVPGFSGDLSLMSAIEADLAVRLPRDER